jgi:uncharacterized protein (TIGR02246 family)
MDDRKAIEELSALKDAAIKASAKNDRDFYSSYLADDAVAIMPQGVFGKADVLKSMQGTRAPFSANRIEDTEIKVLSPDAAVVTYRAIYARPEGEAAVMATTVYRRGRDGWQGVLYQQTPLPAAEAA